MPRPSRHLIVGANVSFRASCLPRAVLRARFAHLPVGQRLDGVIEDDTGALPGVRTVPEGETVQLKRGQVRNEGPHAA